MLNAYMGSQHKKTNTPINRHEEYNIIYLQCSTMLILLTNHGLFELSYYDALVSKLLPSTGFYENILLTLTIKRANSCNEILINISRFPLAIKGVGCLGVKGIEKIVYEKISITSGLLLCVNYKEHILDNKVYYIEVTFTVCPQGQNSVHPHLPGLRPALEIYMTNGSQLVTFVHGYIWNLPYLLMIMRICAMIYYLKCAGGASNGRKSSWVRTPLALDVCCCCVMYISSLLYVSGLARDASSDPPAIFYSTLNFNNMRNKHSQPASILNISHIHMNYHLVTYTLAFTWRCRTYTSCSIPSIFLYCQSCFVGSGNYCIDSVIVACTLLLYYHAQIVGCPRCNDETGGLPFALSLSPVSSVSVVRSPWNVAYINASMIDITSETR
uniref:SID1 transmembrane family member 1 n=1 Tax=Heterorhabditis bacteriophora TaxID=37862 RepID=A0A1I7WH98_HETBA